MCGGNAKDMLSGAWTQPAPIDAALYAGMVLVNGTNFCGFIQLRSYLPQICGVWLAQARTEVISLPTCLSRQVSSSPARPLQRLQHDIR